MEAIRNYVRSGGNLYASKYTSLITKDGTRKDDFLLADLRNRFGQGQVIYTAVDLENSRIYSSIFINLIRLLSNAFSFEADAPNPVEITVFHQEDRRCFIVNLNNFQKELPNIPVQGIRVRVRLDGRTVKRLVSLPEEKELAYCKKGNFVEFCAPQLETFLMFALDYD